ncbi:DUF1501 domain-containing protein [Vibrio sp. ZSDZ65]|uniref:DUF1501 domain-containing protein n=1 Tax=Vibrio qingdaonensis TaxID=2829491 RepID=A0A9X3CTB3_9VIBR|nr:DUF1501 domain-containing protein [Vibrio qingdaonensis]MCW8349105.1 DUF1501 domain-containing protein [Vibrio qingdaonensis]
MTSRRNFLKGIGATSLVTCLPNLAFAATASPNVFVWVTLRGAMDGLNVVVPTFDTAYSVLRPNLAFNANELQGLDGGYGLNPALKNVFEWYQNDEAMFVHACATGYRSRSHFDGQKVLENGTLHPSEREGWLNRFLMSEKRNLAIAIDSGLPLIAQGEMKVSSWYPHKLKAKEEQALILSDLFQSDPELGSNFSEAMKLEKMLGTGSQSKQFANLMTQAGKFINSPQGPNIAVLELGGWDTHSAQGTTQGRLANQLKKLDEGLLALKSALGEKWSSTVVMCASEFGRTARENGTKGTDHGTANVMLLAGGAIKKGQVVSDWPGLADDKLFEGRDLAPTTDVRAVIKGVLADHYLAESGTLLNVFPDSEAITPMTGLITTKQA